MMPNSPSPESRIAAAVPAISSAANRMKRAGARRFPIDFGAASLSGRG